MQREQVTVTHNGIPVARAHFYRASNAGQTLDVDSWEPMASLPTCELGAELQALADDSCEFGYYGRYESPEVTLDFANRDIAHLRIEHARATLQGLDGVRTVCLYGPVKLASLRSATTAEFWRCNGVQAILETMPALTKLTMEGCPGSISVPSTVRKLRVGGRMRVSLTGPVDELNVCDGYGDLHLCGHRVARLAVDCETDGDVAVHGSHGVQEIDISSVDTVESGEFTGRTPYGDEDIEGDLCGRVEFAAPGLATVKRARVNGVQIFDLGVLGPHVDTLTAHYVGGFVGTPAGPIANLVCSNEKTVTAKGWARRCGAVLQLVDAPDEE